MTDKQRLAKLLEAERLLKQTKDGYPGPGKGTFWNPALALLDEVEASLKPVARKDGSGSFRTRATAPAGRSRVSLWTAATTS